MSDAIKITNIQSHSHCTADRKSHEQNTNDAKEIAHF